MELELLRAFFGWYTVLALAVFGVSVLFCALAPDWVYRVQSRFFPLPRPAFDVAIYSFIGAMKLLVLFTGLLPYLALRIIG